MREIAMDTETTGLDALHGDRIVEIGAVELINHVPTGRSYHQYINPERPMPREAFEVHGLGDDFLQDKPVFAAIADAFVEFIGDATLVIHNAPFDMGFLNAEFARIGKPRLPDSRAIDTVAMARKRYPGAQASLDALCRRFNIDNSRREKHGALLDSELLAEVYLELLGGRQQGLSLVQTLQETGRGPIDGTGRTDFSATRRPQALPPRLSAQERTAHAEFIAELGKDALWHRENG